MRVGLLTLSIGLVLTAVLAVPATSLGRCLMDMQLPCDWFGVDLWRVNADWWQPISDYPALLVMPIVVPLTAVLSLTLALLRRLVSVRAS